MESVMVSHKKNILVVEDNPSLQQIIPVRLSHDSHADFNVEVVSSLAECLKNVEKQRPDLILLDLGLPDCDGIETYKQVRQNAAAVPIVILTALNDDLYATEAMRLGAQDYFVKSFFDMKRLSRDVTFAIRRSEAARINGLKIQEIIKVFESADIGILALGNDQKIIAFNAYAKPKLHLDSNDSAQFNFSQFFPDRTWKKAEAMLGSNDAGTMHGDLEMRALMGNVLDVEAAICCLAGEAEERENLPKVFLFHDVSDKKRAMRYLEENNLQLEKFSKQLSLTNEKLKKTDEFKSNFLAAASHELRAPLTSIKGYVSMILKGQAGALTDKQKRYLENVENCGDRLHRLVNSLLNISEIEMGLTKMNIVLTDITPLVQEEVRLFEVQAGNKSISMDLNIDSPLTGIYCDPDQIRQVIDNLLSNAVKYTRKKGSIFLRVSNAGAGVTVRVEDSGIGIRKADLEKIFEPFNDLNRFDDEKKNEESSGLGLSLVKRIIEAHGGTIKVESKIGKGTAFSIFFPADRRKNS